MRTFDMYLLRSACINHKWFESGDINQYNKLFQRNEEGASIEELSIIIWICSTGHKKEDIYRKLSFIKGNLNIYSGEENGTN